jgi:hypothetical protein
VSSTCSDPGCNADTLVSFGRASSGCHSRPYAWRSIAASSGSCPNSRTSCAQRQATAILAAHCSRLRTSMTSRGAHRGRRPHGRRAPSAEHDRPWEPDRSLHNGRRPVGEHVPGATVAIAFGLSLDGHTLASITGSIKSALWDVTDRTPSRYLNERTRTDGARRKRGRRWRSGQDLAPCSPGFRASRSVQECEQML